MHHLIAAAEAASQGDDAFWIIYFIVVGFVVAMMAELIR